MLRVSIAYLPGSSLRCSGSIRYIGIENIIDETQTKSFRSCQPVILPIEI